MSESGRSVKSSITVSTSLAGQPAHPPTEPLCFDPATCEQESFDVNEFISQNRRTVPLATLKKDLERHLSRVSAELVDLINRDYSDFVSLSADLVGIDKLAGAVRTPLVDVLASLEGVGSVVDETIAKVELKLVERQQVLERKAVLERFKNVFQSVEKIEGLLQLSSSAASAKSSARGVGSPLTSATATNSGYSSSSSSGGGGSASSETERARDLEHSLIERVASEFNQLRFYVSGGERLPFIVAMRPRIELIERVLERRIEEGFVRAMTSLDSDSLTLMLRTYATIERTAEAERLYRVHFVGPFMDKNVNREAIEGSQVDSCMGLPTMYGAVVEFVRGQRHQALSRASPNRAFDFFTRSVWEEFVVAVEARCPSLFTPGIPALFHTNYTLTLRFLADMEAAVAPFLDIVAFRNTESYIRFMKKWNFSVYYQLCFSQIAEPFDKAIKASIGKLVYLSSPDSSSYFVLNTSKVLWDGVCGCWNPDVFLTQCLDRFLRLTLQLFQRFSMWLRGGASGAVWKNLSPIEAAALCHDGYLVVEKMTQVHQMITSVLGDYEPMVSSELLQGCLSESGTSIGASCATVESILVAALVDACTSEERLGKMAEIPKAFRHTGLPAPTHASDSVKGLLGPLEVFAASLREGRLQRTPPDLVQRWLLAVINGAVARYTEKARGLLEEVRVAEESLLRFRAASGASTAAAVTSDTEKIYLQFHLDALEIGTAIEGLQVPAPSSEAYLTLQAMVAQYMNTSGSHA